MINKLPFHMFIDKSSKQTNRYTTDISNAAGRNFCGQRYKQALSKSVKARQYAKEQTFESHAYLSNNGTVQNYVISIQIQFTYNIHDTCCC